METNITKVRISPEVLDTIIHDITYQGDVFGVYSYSP